MHYQYTVRVALGLLLLAGCRSAAVDVDGRICDLAGSGNDTKLAVGRTAIMAERQKQRDDVAPIAFLDFLNTFEQAGRPARSRTSHSMTAGLLLRR